MLTGQPQQESPNLLDIPVCWLTVHTESRDFYIGFGDDSNLLGTYTASAGKDSNLGCRCVSFSISIFCIFIIFMPNYVLQKFSSISFLLSLTSIRFIYKFIPIILIQNRHLSLFVSGQLHNSFLTSFLHFTYPPIDSINSTKPCYLTSYAILQKCSYIYRRFGL